MERAPKSDAATRAVNVIITKNVVAGDRKQFIRMRSMEPGFCTCEDSRMKRSARSTHVIDLREHRAAVREDEMEGGSAGPMSLAVDRVFSSGVKCHVTC